MYRGGDIQQHLSSLQFPCRTIALHEGVVVALLFNLETNFLEIFGRRFSELARESGGATFDQSLLRNGYR